jgi:hypothetical protein
MTDYGERLYLAGLIEGREDIHQESAHGVAVRRRIGAPMPPQVKRQNPVAVGKRLELVAPLNRLAGESMEEKESAFRFFGGDIDEGKADRGRFRDEYVSAIELEV